MYIFAHTVKHLQNFGRDDSSLTAVSCYTVLKIQATILSTLPRLLFCFCSKQIHVLRVHVQLLSLVLKLWLNSIINIILLVIN